MTKPRARSKSLPAKRSYPRPIVSGPLPQAPEPLLKPPRVARPPPTIGLKPVTLSSLQRHEDALRCVTFACNHHVSTLATLTPRQASILVVGWTRKGHCVVTLPTRPLTVVLSYPLSCHVRVRVQPWKWGPRRVMTTGWLLWSCAQAYARIFKSWKRYGVWGHGLGDLYFERVTILDDQVQLFVGS